MQLNPDHPANDINDISDDQDYLENVYDRDVFELLRQLPIIAGNDGGQFTMTDLIYEIKLRPFVKEAWTEIEGGPGIAGRILQIAEVYKRAEANLENLTGETRRLPRVIDISSFIEAYTSR